MNKTETQTTPLAVRSNVGLCVSMDDNLKEAARQMKNTASNTTDYKKDAAEADYMTLVAMRKRWQTF